jgi:hypothetical protein
MIAPHGRGTGMSLSRDELLRPSLAGAAVAKAPYSVRTAFLTAFFGGPLAAIAITGINSVRLRRWARDLAPLAALVAAYVAFMLALAWTDWGLSFQTSLDAFAGPHTVSYLHRLIALALFGVGYAMHRKEQRSADFMGLRRPNGWVAGLACIAGSILFLIVFDALIGLENG